LFTVSAALAQKRRDLQEIQFKLNAKKLKKKSTPSMTLPLSLEDQEKEAQAMTMQVLCCFECLTPSCNSFHSAAVVDVGTRDSVS
jgi:hypothetical protein